MLSGSPQVVVKQSSGGRQAVVRRSSGGRQGVVRRSSGGRQAVIRQSSGGHQLVIRRSTCGHLAVVRHLLPDRFDLWTLVDSKLHQILGQLHFAILHRKHKRPFQGQRQHHLKESLKNKTLTGLITVIDNVIIDYIK